LSGKRLIGGSRHRTDDGRTLRIRRKAASRSVGRASISGEAEIRAELAKGRGILKRARMCKVGTGTVQRIKREIAT